MRTTYEAKPKFSAHLNCFPKRCEKKFADQTRERKYYEHPKSHVQKSRQFTGVCQQQLGLYDTCGGQGYRRNISVVEQSADNGTQTPWHLYANQEETFYLLDGEATFWMPDAVQQAKKGAFVSVPKNTRHRFQVTSSKARILNSFYPAGFEQFYIDNLPQIKNLAGENKPELD